MYSRTERVHCHGHTGIVRRKSPVLVLLYAGSRDAIFQTSSPRAARRSYFHTVTEQASSRQRVVRVGGFYPVSFTLVPSISSQTFTKPISL